MKLHRRIVAGTALGLLMAGPLAAAPISAGRIAPAVQGTPIILAQLTAEEQATVEELRERLLNPDLTAEERNAIQEQLDQLEAQAEEAPAPEPEPEAPAVEEPAPEPVPEEAPAEAPAEEAPPAAEEPVDEAPAETEQPADEEPLEEEPVEEAPAEEEPAAEPEAAPAEEPAVETPVEEAPAEEEPAAEPEAAPAEEPAVETPVEEAPAEETPAEAPAEEIPAGQPVEAADPAQDPEGVLPEDAAPVLDSQKEPAPAEGEAQPEQQTAPAEEPAPAPTSDQDAQSQAAPVEAEPLMAIEGERIEEDQVFSRQVRREGSEILSEIGGRIVIQFGTGIFVESNDRPRLRRDATEVYYEDLRGGWTREVIIRADGSQVITIRDQYGDIIRRSRITPDGREYVLVYAGERDRDRPYRWRDPGRELPPLRLTIPVSQYILDARRVEDPGRYYEFLGRPPVEPVRRLYSIDEVKYSARIRDSIRRIDLDIITFEFGSASIAESEIPKLEGVANAMTRLLDENPGETFLIEGHTDAVGSDAANLVLSDRRAESVAAALTDVFGIPPENLVTQGYGERYLKVATQERNRENRRVAIRRITPLVAPVASRN